MKKVAAEKSEREGVDEKFDRIWKNRKKLTSGRFNLQSMRERMQQNISSQDRGPITESLKACSLADQMKSQSTNNNINTIDID